ADQLLSSTDRLQKYCNDPSTSRKLPRDNIFLGMACAAKYSDDMFYRCVPTEINLDYDTASVYFVDFGNSQTVPLTELYELSDDFISQSCYAVRCRLDKLAPPEDSTSYGEEVQQDIDLLAVNEDEVPKKFECRFVSRFEPCLVELKCEGERLDDQLARLNHCRKTERGRYFDGPFKKLDPAKLTRTVAVISYAETPSSMYIYPSHHQPEQDGLMVQLPAEYDDPSSNINSLSKSDAAVGAVCAAKYSVDEAWYRSEIVEVCNDDDTTCTVRFVDYGNTENCKLTDLKKLLFCYGALPALALNVKMDGVIAQETPAALEKFAEIVHQMDTDYAIEFVDLKSPTTVGPFLVKLFVPGETICVNDQLNAAISALCESVVFDEKKVVETLAEHGVVNSSPEPEPAALAACITEKLLNYVDSQDRDDGEIDSQEQKSESVVIDAELPLSESKLIEGEQENDEIVKLEGENSVIAEQEAEAAAVGSIIAIDDSTTVESEN
uniref:Tudor domain-containing protein n=1 Tax=Romanomermis culicivorax TaxID=13658 RepID=A0A915JY69_ROMCU